MARFNKTETNDRNVSVTKMSQKKICRNVSVKKQIQVVIKLCSVNP